VRVPLPAVNKASVRTFSVTVMSRKPQLGRLRISEANDKQFGNASAVAVVWSPTKPSTTLKFSVSILVRRFPSADRVVSDAGNDYVDLPIEFQGDNSPPYRVSHSKVLFSNCAFLAHLDSMFEKSSTVPTKNPPGAYVLESFRPTSAQDSPPEEVLDNVAAAAWLNCPGKPEGDDAGDK